MKNRYVLVTLYNVYMWWKIEITPEKISKYFCQKQFISVMLKETLNNRNSIVFIQIRWLCLSRLIFLIYKYFDEKFELWPYLIYPRQLKHLRRFYFTKKTKDIGFPNINVFARNSRFYTCVVKIQEIKSKSFNFEV